MLAACAASATPLAWRARYKSLIVKVVCLVTVACVAAQAALASAAERPQRTIPCREIIDSTRFPYLGAQPQYRLVLGQVSVPPAYLVSVSGRWRFPDDWLYFAKSGMVVKSSTSVTITVPPAWRKRVGISWGNNVHRVFQTIRIAACRSRESRVGYAYAGGFFLRKPSACVPLVFAVGERRQTVWFGIKRRCHRLKA